jgi:hypothetical protein
LFILDGLQSILLLLVDSAFGHFVMRLLVDSVREMSGRPKRVIEPKPATPMTPGQRTASALIGAMAFCGIQCFGLMAVCFGRGEGILQADDRDFAKLQSTRGRCSEMRREWITSGRTSAASLSSVLAPEICTSLTFIVPLSAAEGSTDDSRWLRSSRCSLMSRSPA